ncbi:type II toxin-antitoxin system HicA family toxin [Methyloprofundus sp.]|uniref:type II toxin-antitoxin system HicA family toxin n=1 Tax=Methyloprofundus sp. TaxID=2020875 RepID=UPI003D0FCCC2
MGKIDKLLQVVFAGTSDASIAFKSLCALLKRMEFEERIKGDHHIFTRKDIEEIINLQPVGSKAKPYQVKQIRRLFIKHQLGTKNVK